MKQNTIFETLGKLQVSDKTQKKGRFSYLSWAWAWHILKQNYPNSSMFTKGKDTKKKDWWKFWDFD